MSDEFPEFAAVADAIVAGDLAAVRSARMLGLLPDDSDSAADTPRAARYASDNGLQFEQRKGAQLHRQRSQSSGGGTSSPAEGAAGSHEDSPSRQRHKSIAAVKLEQDLEIKACEEAAAMQGR
jgi:hypothetical protein